MNDSSRIAEVLRPIFVDPRDGVVGLVDDLLETCRQYQLQIDWRLNSFLMRSASTDWEELAKVPMDKSAFRAVLARVAALCNQHHPNSVSAYSGKCELASNAGDRTFLEIHFENTPSEQKLEVVARPRAKRTKSTKARTKKR